MTDRDRSGKALKKSEGLVAWLIEQPDTSFPAYFKDKGEKSYPDKYKDLALALVPLHNNVEKGAMVESIRIWHSNLIANIEKSDLPAKEKQKRIIELLAIDPVVYLNQHGVGHVELVIKKAFDLLCHFRDGCITPFEGFILLSAIQLHDIGNIFGRDGHEKNIKRTTIDLVRNAIPDTVTQNSIYCIAKVHGGNINGSKDTFDMSALRTNRLLFDMQVRETLLASLLRFADELADDYTRADEVALQNDTLPQNSMLYHQYSKSLHEVSLVENDLNQTVFVQLEYYVDFELITKRFSKGREQVLLLDEIYERTRKMERERRYCLRNFRQYLPLEEIHVRIELEPEFDDQIPKVLQYTLNEKGYPTDEIIIECPENTGEKVIISLQKENWRLINEYS
jgi:hypothetical protein